ncbi:DDE-type integrase/transposase/recombinase [Actinomadura mexicana]|uniref:DDE-type integrase/transposase/recombinase n=1 Tax=Actinomadura mexicana TaxID=134959 RepID=UPI003CCB78E1
MWVIDIIEHPTREGKIYCCVVIDAFSLRGVGWAIDSRRRSDLATSALGMALVAGAVAVREAPASAEIPWRVIRRVGRVSR